MGHEFANGAESPEVATVRQAMEAYGGEEAVLAKTGLGIPELTQQVKFGSYAGTLWEAVEPSLTPVNMRPPGAICPVGDRAQKAFQEDGSKGVQRVMDGFHMADPDFKVVVSSETAVKADELRSQPTQPLEALTSERTDSKSIDLNAESNIMQSETQKTQSSLPEHVIRGAAEAVARAQQAVEAEPPMPEASPTGPVDIDESQQTKELIKKSPTDPETPISEEGIEESKPIKTQFDESSTPLPSEIIELKLEKPSGFTLEQESSTSPHPEITDAEEPVQAMLETDVLPSALHQTSDIETRGNSDDIEPAEISAAPAIVEDVAPEADKPAAEAILQLTEMSDNESPQAEQILSLLPEAVQESIVDYLQTAEPEIIEEFREAIVQMAMVLDRLQVIADSGELDGIEAEQIQDWLKEQYTELLTSLAIETSETGTQQFIDKILVAIRYTKTQEEPKEFADFLRERRPHHQFDIAGGLINSTSDTALKIAQLLRIQRNFLLTED